MFAPSCLHVARIVFCPTTRENGPFSACRAVNKNVPLCSLPTYNMRTSLPTYNMRTCLSRAPGAPAPHTPHARGAHPHERHRTGAYTATSTRGGSAMSGWLRCQRQHLVPAPMACSAFDPALHRRRPNGAGPRGGHPPSCAAGILEEVRCAVDALERNLQPNSHTEARRRHPRLTRLVTAGFAALGP